MGYSTDFFGEFKLNQPLRPVALEFLNRFAGTRRMARNVDSDIYGIEGEFYVYGGGDFGQNREPNIIDYNKPPKSQPGLWCHWVPNEDGTAIKWDSSEKFYNYIEWLYYIIHKLLIPNGYVLNGTVEWQGEYENDIGVIHVVENIVVVQPLNQDATVFNGVVEKNVFILFNE